MFFIAGLLCIRNCILIGVMAVVFVQICVQCVFRSKFAQYWGMRLAKVWHTDNTVVITICGVLRNFDFTVEILGVGKLL